jgi:membrane-associated phospholipid phosphatase
MSAAHGTTFTGLDAAPHRYRARGRSGLPGSGVKTPLAIAALCVVALALTWVVAALVPAGEFKDALALHDFTMLGHTRASVLANGVLNVLQPSLFVFWALAVVAVALARKQWRVALAAALVMALTPTTAELLKPLTAHPHVRIGAVTVGAASWPSGHSSAALALALCAVLVAPARWRPFVAAFGAGFAVIVGCSLLILAWHMPSDVLGGYLLAALWTALAVAGLRAAERRWPSARSVSRSGAGGATLGTMPARVPE